MPPSAATSPPRSASPPSRPPPSTPTRPARPNSPASVSPSAPRPSPPPPNAWRGYVIGDRRTAEPPGRQGAAKRAKKGREASQCLVHHSLPSESPSLSSREREGRGG